MDDDATHIDSTSVGDPARFVALAELARGLAARGPAPRDRGRVALIVRKAEGGRRETPARVRLSPADGVPGDAWGRKPTRRPDTQIAVMDVGVAELIANRQPLVLFGDNLLVDLDLSEANLPVGSRVRAGAATLEVTPEPHTGCKKFRARFGGDALRFVATPDLRHRHLRGIYLRVIEAGEVAVGDPVDVVSRG
jgi:MOSC domain